MKVLGVTFCSDVRPVPQEGRRSQYCKSDQRKAIGPKGTYYWVFVVVVLFFLHRHVVKLSPKYLLLCPWFALSPVQRNLSLVARVSADFN